LHQLHKRKEVNLMKYDKPSILKFAEAASAIQGGKSNSLNDNPPDQPTKTVPAYEGDE
jgi:hypothetical protein